MDYGLNTKVQYHPEGEFMLLWIAEGELSFHANAHKYTPEKGKLQILAKANLGEHDQSELVHVSVIDDGFGISSEDQEKIFQQFFRSEDKNVRETTGTGLGLSITKRLVEMQGGELWFESELGNGTSFHFTIPTAENS